MNDRVLGHSCGQFEAFLAAEAECHSQPEIMGP